MRKILPKVELSMPNAQFKFCQPKCDRLKASTIINLIEGDVIHHFSVAMIPAKINLEPK
ncbi:hypothetical protein [Nostoc sp. DedQUE02]|uniref:hypothetical protein n=1 Tax=Nostoc sp. DedQUE02 TaxID=3075388 RepID=UPI002AD3FAD3|nr:hypothetical protein [Nostoc sp. DedQUE03]